MQLSHSQEAFLALVRSGLWETSVKLDYLAPINYSALVSIAEVQRVVGLVAAGLELSDLKVPQTIRLSIVGKALQIEQRNVLMGEFTAEIVERLREVELRPLLVKGQGVGQCYARPQWRASGDIDFFFSKEEYPKAVLFFLRLEGAKVVQNARYTKSFGVVVNSWFIEIHGTLRNGLSTKMDREIDKVQMDLFHGGRVRSWINEHTRVLLPGVNEDVFLVFVHFVRHFYKERVYIRQLCDWCRLLWSFRSEIDIELLELRLKCSGLVTEWKVFSSFVVDYLGMPIDSMPLYDSQFKAKSFKIMEIILEGNTSSKIKDTWHKMKVFPFNTLKFLPGIFFNLNWLKVKELLCHAS